MTFLSMLAKASITISIADMNNPHTRSIKLWQIAHPALFELWTWMVLYLQ